MPEPGVARGEEKAVAYSGTYRVVSFGTNKVSNIEDIVIHRLVIVAYYR